MEKKVFTIIFIASLFFLTPAFAHHTGNHSGSGASKATGGQGSSRDSDDHYGDEDVYDYPLQTDSWADSIRERKGASPSTNVTKLSIKVELQTGLFAYEDVTVQKTDLFESGEVILSIDFKSHPHSVVFRIRGRQLDFEDEQGNPQPEKIWALRVTRTDYDGEDPYARSKPKTFLVQTGQLSSESFGEFYKGQFRNFKVAFSIPTAKKQK